MGTTSSRESSTRHKYKQKILSIKRGRRSYAKSDISSPFTSTTSIVQPTPVHLVKHQVVLSDHVSPLSSLSAAIASPMSRTSWRKSTTSRTTNNDNTSLSSCFDDDEEVISSPRTSIGSEDISNGFLKVEQQYNDKRKKAASFSSFISSFKKDGNNIIFESKYNAPTLSIPASNNEKKPFWLYTQGDEKEYDRQLRQHYVLKYVLNGNIHVPMYIDKKVTILDAACGAGFWTLDMVNMYPNAKVISLDSFPSEDRRSKAYSIAANNIVYKHGDLTSHLLLPDNYVDIIYQRDTASYMPSERWPFLFNEYLRILKPGGYVEIVEYDFNIRDPGPVLALVNEWYKIASASVGVNSRETKNLHKILDSAGFEQVQKETISIPIGEWPTDENEKEKGFLYKQVIRALFKSMKSWWITELGVSEQEYDKVMLAAMDEFNDQCCYIDWFIYTARKPMEYNNIKDLNSSNVPAFHTTEITLSNTI